MKFSIITPAYNMAPYIRETVESVLSQKGNFEIEYIIMNGGSTDGTVEILKKYEQLLNEKKYPIKCTSITFKWDSGKDKGMYDAINKGFSMATGDIYAWINADDMYESDAFQTIKNVLETFPEIEWVKGINKNIEEDGSFIKQNKSKIYHQTWLQKGLYGRVAYFVEQDTVFWRSRLWKKIGQIPEQYKYAGDYWLWINFSRHTKLWSINKNVSVFRKRKDQISQNISSYKREQTLIKPSLGLGAVAVRIFFNLEKRLGPTYGRFFSTLYKFLFLGNKKEYFVDTFSNSQYIKKEWNIKEGWEATF